MKINSRFITLSLLTHCFIQSMMVCGQGVTIEPKIPPSVVGAGTFVSPQGRFSIALPARAHGFRPVSIVTPLAKGDGNYFDWVMKEGVFSAAFMDFPGPVDTEQAKMQRQTTARARWTP